MSYDVNDNAELYLKCINSAEELISKGYPVGDVTVEQLTDTLYKLEKEKQQKNEQSDRSIDYNDEIVSIEDMGVLETVDISVSGDNLFYCNGILTKNSFGLPATADMMFALVSTEDLEKVGQLMVKQLKNRYNDPTAYKRFIIGVDRSKMKLFDVDESAQTLMNDEAVQVPSATKPSEKFSGFKV